MKKKIKKVVVSGMIATTIVQSFTGNAANWAKINNEWNYNNILPRRTYGELRESAFRIWGSGYGFHDMQNQLHGKRRFMER